LISIWVRALTVPKHLALIDGPLVPHHLISAQESHYQSSRWPPDLKSYVLWVQERDPDILPSSLKKSGQANPIQVPQRGS